MLSLIFILACGDETETVKVEEPTKTEAPIESDETKKSDKVIKLVYNTKNYFKVFQY